MLMKNKMSLSLLLSGNIHFFAAIILASSLSRPLFFSQEQPSSSQPVMFCMGTVEVTSSREEISETEKKHSPDMPLQKKPGETPTVKKETTLFRQKRIVSTVSQKNGDAGLAHKTYHSEAESSQYISAIREKIRKSSFYPFHAKLKGFQGQVMLAFHINPEGDIKNITILQPSPHKVLNTAAFQIVQKASPFPHPPKDFNHTVQIPITFCMKN